MAEGGRRSVPAWLRHIYLYTSRIQYPRRKEGAKMTMKLKALVESLPGARPPCRDAEIRGVTCDSRQVSGGMLFVAVSGTREDGAAYVDEAIRRGAGAIVAEKEIPGCPVPVVVVPDARAALADAAALFYGHPSTKLNVVGITGTNGKTTVSYLLRSIFEASGQKAGLLGTIQHSVGSRLLPSDNTTPGADTLQRYFNEMVGAGCKAAAMEVSSHALSQDRVRGIRFAASIFTNLTRDHLDYHPTFQAYREAKGRLFQMLSPKAIAVLNADDAASAYFRKRTPARVVTYGMRRKADLGAKIELSTFNGTRIRLRLGSEEKVVHTRLIGAHNAYNILAAAACTWTMGFDLDQIKAGIENLATVPGRLEPVDVGQEFAVLVDYAHTDDALHNVLQCLKPLLRGRLIVVFGCGGDRDRGKRPRMGRVAERHADRIIVTSDNPRSESPMSILRDIAGGIEEKSKYVIDPDRRSAIKLAITLARKDDVVLIAGKGHETVQVFKDRTKMFDDRQVSREVLNELAKK